MKETELIILPCHSIWKGGTSLGKSPEEWFLAPFQKEGNDHLCFCDHIKTSFELLKKNPRALLVITGGQTKSEAGRVSESSSYYNLLKDLFPHSQQDLQRVYTEDYARDSFENVIFSICRFYEICGKYPTKLTIVGFEFKKKRFITYHLKKALLFPEELVSYVGNNPKPKNDHDFRAYFEELEASEKKHALKPFAEDLYGLRSPLRTKRLQRDPFRRQHEYQRSNPELAEFLECLKDSAQAIDDSAIQDTIKIKWGL